MNDLKRAVSGLPELDAVVLDVIASGWWLRGPETESWESELAQFIGAEHAIGVATGTDALELALRSVAPESGVIVTAANCGGYTTTAARRGGFRVRYADVDETTHVLTAQGIEAVLDADVVAVVVTHLYGRAAELTEIRALCDKHGVALVEDCAQAIGARDSEGRRVGSIGDIAAFSFYPTKNLGAMGDAGAVTTNSSSVAERVRVLSQYGWTSKYQIGVDGGRNSRIDEIQAAILRRRLPSLDQRNDRRREILARYASAASQRISVLNSDGGAHVAHLAVVVTDDPAALRAHLSARGVDSDVHYPTPDHRQAAIAHEYSGISLPVTEALATRIVSIPLFPELTDSEIERVSAALSCY